MSRTGVLLASLFLCLVLGGTAGPPVREIPATSTLYNGSEPFLFSIRSDQTGIFGAYPNSGTVRSVVAEDWILDTQPFKATPTRSVWIDFTDPISGTGPNGIPQPPFAMDLVHARFIAKCHERGFHMLDMLRNEKRNCPLAVGLHNGYLIVMNHVNYPLDTDDVWVTCTRLDLNNKCNQWTIKPYSLDISPTSRGKLIGPPTGTKPNDPGQDMGNFRFSFDIEISIP
jgi:hypothetical protein